MVVNKRMDAVLRALAEPRRRDILALVAQDELSAGEIASHFSVTRPAISQHLGVLKAARLVAERRDGTRRLYAARPEGLSELRSFFEEFWDKRLGRLKQAAEADERSKRHHAINQNKRHRTRNKDQR
jgi:DNA-binding transcriptional ArsR family regulator